MGEDILSEIGAKIDMENRKMIVNDEEVEFISINKDEEQEVLLNNLYKKEVVEESEDSEKVVDIYESEKIIEADDIFEDFPEKDFIKMLIKSYPGLSNEENRIAKNYAHKLIVKENTPFNCKNYPVPYRYREQVNKELQQMITDGILERSKTNFINPLVIVQKKDKTIRICLDARNLNKITEPQFEQPESIEAIMGRLGNKKIFSKLDLKNSFWLIPLERDSRKYCGFKVDGNIFQFKVVPFGLSTASAALVRAMQIILNKYEQFSTHYIDDILIFSNNVEEHKEHLKLIFKELDDAGLKLNIQKCEFFKEKVKYLGYDISQQGISINKERIQEIKDYPRPKNLRTLRGFLGVLNYYKRFIPELSDKQKPLIQLLRKNVKFNWDIEQQRAFEEIKKSFHENLLLRHPDYDLTFILRTDASNFAISAELVQIQDGIEVPICFISRTLKGSEIRYTVSEKEMLAVIFAILKLKFYLAGNKFIVETDHSSLTFLMNNRFANNRMYRWALLISEFTFEIRHRSGKYNVTADALSRCHASQEEKPNTFLMALNKCLHNTGIYSLKEIKESNRRMEDLKIKIQNKQVYKGFFIKEDLIIKKIGDQELYVIDENLAIKILNDLHLKFGHVGIRKLWLIYRENYYTNKDLNLCKDIISKCHLCCLGKNKNHINHNTIQSIIVNKPLEMIAIDFISNLVPSTHHYKNILVIVDLFSKYVRVFPTKKCDNITIINILLKYFEQEGIPENILCDNATYFNNFTLKTFCEENQIRLRFTSIRHPKGNPSERYIQDVIKFLRLATFHKHQEWVKHLKEIQQFINEIPNVTTNLPPIVIFKGIEPKRPWEKSNFKDYQELLERVRKRLAKNAKRYILKENKKIKKRIKFLVGDKVIIRSLKLPNPRRKICAKLQLPFEGPFMISKVIGENSYELFDPEKERIRGRFNIDMLYPYTVKDSIEK